MVRPYVSLPTVWSMTSFPKTKADVASLAF